jgi:outer membrane protease
MQTRWLVALVSALSLPPLATAEGTGPLTLEVGTSALFGWADEEVFDPSASRFFNDPVSRLAWPVSPSFGLSLAARMAWVPWATTSVTVQGAWPVVSDTMSDEDWRAPTLDGFLVHGLSRSDSYVTAHWSVVAEQGFRWDAFTFGFGGLFQQTSWEAWGGTSRYEYTNVVKEYQFNGLVLEYRQVWFIPFLSAQWSWTIDQWTITPSMRVAPYTWCLDTDNHMFADKRITYLDNTRGGWYGLAGLEVTFPVAGVTLGLRGTYETAWGAIGETYPVEPAATAPGTTISFVPGANAAGAGFSQSALSLFVRN